MCGHLRNIIAYLDIILLFHQWNSAMQSDIIYSRGKEARCSDTTMRSIVGGVPRLIRKLDSATPGSY